MKTFMMKMLYCSALVFFFALLFFSLSQIFPLAMGDLRDFLHLKAKSCCTGGVDTRPLGINWNFIPDSGSVNWEEPRLLEARPRITHKGKKYHLRCPDDFYVLAYFDSDKETSQWGKEHFTNEDFRCVKEAI